MDWRPAILGAVFALHNLEGVFRFEAWQHVGMTKLPVDHATFAVAVILLTVAV